jgi:hypothetical protein
VEEWIKLMLPSCFAALLYTFLMRHYYLNLLVLAGGKVIQATSFDAISFP